MKSLHVFFKKFLVLSILLVGGCQTLQPASFQQGVDAAQANAAKEPCSTKPDIPKKDACGAERYTFSRADEYNSFVKGRDTAKMWVDLGLIGIGAATAASLAFKASSTSISALALGGVTAAGVRTYLLNDSVSAAYMSGSSALSCVGMTAEDFSSIPPAPTSLSKNVQGDIDKAEAVLNDPTLPAGADKDALDKAIQAAKTALAPLVDAEGAYNGFAVTMMNAVWTIEGNTFKKARGAVPDVTGIVADIQKQAGVTASASAAQQASNGLVQSAHALVPQATAKAAAARVGAATGEKPTITDQANAWKGTLTDDVTKINDETNEFVTPMNNLIQKLKACPLNA